MQLWKARRCISYRRRNQMGNRRNSKMQKQLQISLGEVTVSTPRDRNVGYSVNVRVSNKWDYL
ncbi:putative transposase [Bacteroides caccae CAG:21]|nr:putative transposase [Bacteroides caccae CAG:21]